MYRDRRICVIVPAHNERDHVAWVIRSMPDWVDHVVVDGVVVFEEETVV